MQPKILIIDDNPTHRLLFRIWLEECAVPPYRVIEAINAADGQARIIVDAPDCVVLDFILGEGDNGFQMLHQVKGFFAECPPIILLTCAYTDSLRRNALALGAFACLDKSTITKEQFLKIIGESLKTRAEVAC